MKSILKDNFLLLFICVLINLACSDKLDLFPNESISPEQLNKRDLPQLLNGVYNKSTVGVGNRFIDFDLLANHFKSTELFAGNDANYVRNRLSPSQTETWWLELYEIIYNANTLLLVIENLEVSSGNKKGDFDAEKSSALYLRALSYYYLVTRFGGVPLIEKNSRDKVARSTIDESWSFIKSDLKNATSIAPNFSDQNHVSIVAIKALRARVFLALSEKSEAEKYAEEVITSAEISQTKGNFTLTDDFGSIFSNSGSDEIIFSLGNNPEQLTRQYVTFNPNDHAVSGSQIYAPTDDTFDNLFETRDKRKSTTLALFKESKIVNKYTQGANLPVVVSRLAEMYLISAEAKGYPNGVTRLNELRANRGLPAVSVTNEEELLNAVLDERQREFYAEGFYWYDLVRTGKAIERLTNVTENNQLLLPIPQREVDLADLKQNPGY